MSIINCLIEEVYSSSYLLFRDIIHEERNQQTSDSTNPVRHAHQDTGVSWRDIQMIDIETRDGKTTARDADRESDRSCSTVLGCRRMGHH